MTDYERIKLEDDITNAILQLADIFHFAEKYPNDEELGMHLGPLVEARLETIVNNCNELKKEREI